MSKWSKFFSFVRMVYQGKTIRRIQFNWKLEEYCPTFTGTVLDLGAGSGSLVKKLIGTRANVVSTDITARDGVTAVDLNTTLPYQDGSIDVVTLFNVLYILEDQKATLREIYRVLKPGGTCYVSSPLIAAEIPEPHDYCRLTYEGLERLFRGIGFSKVSIERIGGRATSASVILHPFFVFNTIRLFVFSLCLFLDRITRKGDIKHPVPHLYFCIVTK